ncbi:MAG TPA: hypothetical protein VFW94_06845 [Candidatus Acidoferrales bacterium]|nr:hypothetical protein [Candidatus Acidoferrales bacterium]
MDLGSQFDIFEIMPDGAPIWRCSTVGQEAALLKLDSLGQSCHNELIAVHLPSSRVVARKAATLGAAIASPAGNGKHAKPEKPAN